MSVRQGNKILSGKLKTNVGGLSANITDCILSVENKLKFVLQGNILYLKAGSKMSDPSGVEHTLTYDKSINWGGTEGVPTVVFINVSGNQGVGTWRLSSCVSGDTDPLAGQTYHVWFDTQNKIIKGYSADANNPSFNGASFPLAIIYFNSNGVDRVERIFNGFGYIGQHVFVTPGVTAAIPDGRNEDGTLKNIILKTSTAKYSVNTNSDRTDVWLDSGGSINRIFPGAYAYNEKENLRKTTPGGAIRNSILVGQITGNISTCDFFTPFHAAEYKDLKKLEDDAVHKTGAETIPGDKSFTGNVSLGSSATASTPAYSDNDTSVATTAMVHNLNDTQRTNCITEIPQDINLTLSNGTLTLKAGSKVYVPNGAGVFNVVTLTADKTATQTTNDTRLYFYNGTYIEKFPVTQCFSGTSAPSGYQYMFWYDTTNNVVKKTSNSGSTWESGWSLPFCIATASGGALTTVDQVFNGFGYIGSTIFALPGVKFLAPYGRNEDGTLKNDAYTISNVTTRTQAGTQNSLLAVNSIHGTFGVSAATGNYAYVYNEKDNLIYLQDAVSDRRCVIGSFTETSGVISNFNIKTPFHAVDYDDLKKVSDNMLVKTGSAMTSYLSNVLSTPQVRNISIGTSQPSNPIQGDVFLLI